jgi:hypothetical protein
MAPGASLLARQTGRIEMAGLGINAAERLVRFTRARLPPYLEQVSIRGLRVGPVTVDLRLRRHEHDVGISVLHRTGAVEIVAIK